MPQTIAYLDCQAGISGEMLLGALLDAGLPLTTLQDSLAALPVKGYELKAKTITAKGIRGTWLQAVPGDQQQLLRTLSDITALLDAAQLPATVYARALASFQRLAEAKAALEGTQGEGINLPEDAGTIATLIAIVGAATGIEFLGITQLYASPLPLTSGHVSTVHGLLPVPSPLVLEMMRRVNAPWQPHPVQGELVTPVGAAILAATARFDVPPIVIERVGYGFGERHMSRTQYLRLCIGKICTSANVSAGDADTDWVTVIETHIDNMSGELLGGLMERLFTAGALDVSYTPIQMKKSRPATMITVICSPTAGEQLAMLLLRETTTLGVRMQQVQRLKAQREQRRIETPLGSMLVKVKRLGARVINVAPEYEECQRIATERQLPLAEVYEVVQQAAQSLF